MNDGVGRSWVGLIEGITGADEGVDAFNVVEKRSDT